MSTNVPRSGFFQKTVDHATENFKGYFLPASDYVSICDFILERVPDFLCSINFALTSRISVSKKVPTNLKC